MTVTRARCKTKGCPFTPDDHGEWMALCRQAPEHGHRDDQLSHQHLPKKGMGGHNQRSRIVAILCWPMHDRIDNGDWGNSVVTTFEDGKKIEIYRAWDLHNKTIIERVINGALSDGAEARGGSKGQVEYRPRKPEIAGSSPAPDKSSASSLKEEIEPVLSAAAEERGRGSDSVELSIPKTESSAAAPSAGLTHDQRVAIAATIKDAEQGRQWFAGDTANAWRAELGEEAEQYISDFGYQQESIANIMRVCEAIPPAFRHGDLRFSHHVVVADLNREDIEMWLDKCVEEGWSVAEFRRQVKGERPRVKRWSAEELISPGEEFLNGYPEPPRVAYTEAIDFFIDWLGDQST